MARWCVSAAKRKSSYQLTHTSMIACCRRNCTLAARSRTQASPPIVLGYSRRMFEPPRNGHHQPRTLCRTLLIAGPNKFENSRSVQFVGSPTSEQSAHHAADQASWTATATPAVMVSTTPAATTGQMVVIGFVAAAGARVRR
jgi:hypothetical protein